MNKVTIRSISQLPQLTSNITDGSLFEISHHDESDNSYSSNNIKYEILNKKIQSDEAQVLSTDYGLYIGINVANIEKDVSSLIHATGEKELSGTIIFKERPYYLTKNSYYQFLTTGEAEEMFGSSSQFSIRSDSYVDNVGTLTAHYKEDENIPTLVCQNGGILTMYGWMIDTGNISPAQSYVSLQAKIRNEWVDIQHSPWILGDNHKYLQYVSFTVPVQSGLEIRVVSGFELGSESSYNQNKKNTLTNQEINIFRCTIIN